MFHANVNVNLIKQNVIQINGGITINVSISVKKIIYVKKKIVCNSATSSCENGKYLAGIMDDSVITCDKVIDEDYEKMKLTKRKQSVKYRISIIYLLFY